MQQSVLSEVQIDAWRAAIRRTTFADYHYEMGIAILRDKDSANAIRHFRQALDIQPDHWRAAYRLAEALRDTGGAAESARFFDAAERGLPGITSLLVAETLTARLDTDAAPAIEKDVRDLLARDPSNVPARLGLAVALLKQHRVTEVGPVLEALGVPASCEVPDNLLDHLAKEILLLVWRGQLAVVVETAEKLRKAAPGHAGLGNLLAYVHLLRRQPDRALAALSTVTDPLGSLALVRKTLALAGLGQWDAVADGLSNLEQADALLALRALLTSLLHRQHGDAAAALDWAARGAAAPDATPTNLLLHAVLLDQAGETDRAQGIARTAMDKAKHLIDFSVSELAVPALMEQAGALLERVGWTVRRL
ncbi:hypothetical protein FBY14_12612 [Azospirillum brasilense]|nr:hypothetical protein FBY14_12612 [Azospirillum brasilense]